MSHEFDKPYWEEHWRQAYHPGVVNPYLEREIGGLAPGTALDAGCGEGAEASWLASQGWQVTGADISAEALARAAGRDAAVRWVEADLTTWEPDSRFDLVATHYAHPAMPQLAFYQRIAEWVAPRGTLLIVGHLHNPGHHPPEATVTLADMTAALDPGTWEILTAAEHRRSVASHALFDAVVRATRRT